MAEQGNLFTSSKGKAPGVQQVVQQQVVQPVPRQRPPRSIPRWLVAIEISLFVILRLYVGALVFLLPWRSVWTTNAWINHWPIMANFIAQGWVRGLVSGLGLLNIWIALSALFRRQPRY